MLPFAPQIGHGSQLPPARVTCSRTLLGAWQPWPVRSSPKPNPAGEVIGFEELLSELIARARMLRPHLGSRLVSAMLTYGVRCRTLSNEERCGGRMKASPVKSMIDFFRYQLDPVGSFYQYARPGCLYTS